MTLALVTVLAVVARCVSGTKRSRISSRIIISRTSSARMKLMHMVFPYRKAHGECRISISSKCNNNDNDNHSVFTVFSTSKDHRQGEKAMAGCILIDNDKIQVINRSPKYKNKYVHRRTSLSVANLTPKEVSLN